MNHEQAQEQEQRGRAEKGDKSRCSSRRLTRSREQGRGTEKGANVTAVDSKESNQGQERNKKIRSRHIHLNRERKNEEQRARR